MYAHSPLSTNRYCVCAEEEFLALRRGTLAISIVHWTTPALVSERLLLWSVNPDRRRPCRNSARPLGNVYQRDSRRWRKPPPLCGLREKPPPSLDFGRASFTFNARPSSCLPFRPAMACLACELSAISTNAKPRERPVSLSVTTLT